MAFIMKKKKYKFKVMFYVEELSAVSLVNSVLFAKVRLLEGGTFSEVTNRKEVNNNNCVQWKQTYSFCCKMSANASTGILDPCVCRVSVRRESKGGRSFQKLGFVDVNLAEFAGVGICSRRHLLQGYDTKHRQDNSMLNVTLEMTLLSGDPCFKRAQSAEDVEFKPSTVELDSIAAAPPATSLIAGSQALMKDDQSSGSVASVSSGFESLPRKHRPNILATDLSSGCGGTESEPLEDSGTLDVFEPGHSRNSSYASQQSKASGYSSLHSHSRQNSAESGGHIRNPSSGSTYSDMGFPGQPKSMERKRPPSRKNAVEESRMDATRVSADQLISEIIGSTTFEADEIAESIYSGLTLVINKDGTAGLGSQVVTQAGKPDMGGGGGCLGHTTR